MVGKVFISCGQRSLNEKKVAEQVGPSPQDEKKIAEQVETILREEFHLNPYLAFKIQSLDDIMTIISELRSSDYYLFIDFLRDPKNLGDWSYSLFTHQELALAYHLGFRNEMIALRQERTTQKGAKLEGFLRYVLGNPEPFRDEAELLDKIRFLIREKGWTADYSRNLVVSGGEWTLPLQYTDHTGTSTEKVWQVRVDNKRPDIAAVGAVCILDYIKTADGTKTERQDRAYLKWAGQQGYERTILPQDFGLIDLFAIRPDTPGVFLHSLRDTLREPILIVDGDYELFFKVFSQGFQLVEFSVKLNYRWTRYTSSEWSPGSTATLVE